VAGSAEAFDAGRVPLPAGSERLRALAECGLTNASDPEMDYIAGRVRDELGVRIAVVSLFQDGRLVLPGQVGLPQPWASGRAASSEDLASELGAAGSLRQPLTDADGSALGELWAMDTQPRAWSGRELAVLRLLAKACSGEDYAVDEIIAEVEEWDCRHVVLTGGEPMLFAELLPLCRELRARGRHITIETAGTLYLPAACDLMSISPKLAGSGPDPATHPRWRRRHERERLKLDVLARLIGEYDYQLKFVVDRPEDVDEVAAGGTRGQPGGPLAFADQPGRHALGQPDLDGFKRLPRGRHVVGNPRR